MTKLKTNLSMKEYRYKVTNVNFRNFVTTKKGAKRSIFQISVFTMKSQSKWKMVLY